MKKLDFADICRNIAPQYSIETDFNLYEHCLFLVLHDAKLNQHTKIKLDYIEFEDMNISNTDIVNELIKLHQETFKGDITE